MRTRIPTNIIRTCVVTVSLASACLMLLGSGPVLAQVTGTAPVPPPARLERSPVTLSLDDAVRMALEHNLDIAVDRLEPHVSGARVAQAASAFQPVLNSTVTRNSQLSPPTSFLVGNVGVQTDLYSSSVGWSQRLPWFGSSYAVAWDSSRTSTTSTFTNFNPSLTSRVQASLSQPLLRDLLIDNTRQQLQVTKRNREISDARFKETVARTLDTVKKAYWDLVSARSSVEVQKQSLSLAEELVRIDKARVAVGQMPELDLLAAQAEAAQRQEALTIADVNARQAEDRLRTLIFDPEQPDFWDTPILVTDRPAVGLPVPDVEQAVAQALKGRWDLVRARKDLENARTSTRFYSNQRLPDLRLVGNYQASGLAGDRLIRTGGFPGTIVGTQATAFRDALNQVFARDFPTWTVGLSFSYPIGRSYDDAALAAARLQEAQAKARVQSLEMRVVRQIRQAAWQLDMNRRRIETSRAARQLAERRLDSEQKRFEVGMSTSFLVVQAQRDLAQARNNELSATLDYTRSLTDFEALQEASLESTGSAVTVSSGGTISTSGTNPAATALSTTTGASSGVRIQ